MTWTKSKDGVLRTDVYIKHRIGRQDLIDGIIWKISREYWTDEAAFKSHFKTGKEVFLAAQEAISHDGDSVWTAVENLDNADAVQSFAVQTVDKLFGVLKPNK